MTMVRKVQRYGWRPDTPDHRDRIYNLEEPIRQPHQLPLSVDLQPEMPDVYDQGQLGSCTANATAAIFEHQALLESEPASIPSRLFIYYEERRIEGQPLDQDTGAEVRDGIKVLVTEGAPPETEWPYDVSQFAVRPSDQAYKDAQAHEATAYKRIVIGPGAPMRTAIFNHQPIAFGFPVPDYFEGGWNPLSEPLPLPQPDTQIIGGHAVVIVGYDYTQKLFPVRAFKVRNSWGPSFGIAGHYWMDSRWFDPWRQLANDLWVIQRTT